MILENELKVVDIFIGTTLRGSAKRTVFNTIVSGLIGAITTGLIWAAVRASQMF